MQLFATAPLSISRVWAEGFRLTRERLLMLFPLFIINQVILTLSAHYFARPETSLVHMLQQQPIYTLGFIIISGIITIIFYAIGFYMMGTLMQGKPYTIMEALQATFHKLPVLILASILALLATLAGFAVLIIPGIFIAIATFFYLPSIILDNMSAFAAFKYTLTLIWGNWWRSFIIIATPIFVGLIINWLITFIIMLIIVFSQSGHAASLSPINYIPEGFSILIQAFVDIFVLALQIIQWNDLKLRKQLKQITVSIQ